MTPSLQKFLKTGIKPPSDRERSALLDESRSFIESIAAEVRNWTPPETPAAVEAIKRGAEAAKAKARQAQAELDARIAAQREKLRKQAASKPAAKPAAKVTAPSATPLLDTFNTMTGDERTRFYQQNERGIRLETLRANSPEAIIPSH